MTDTAKIADAVLITLSGDERSNGGAVIFGKSIAERQLEFAIAAGCRKLVILGNGAAPEAIKLRHRAEGQKAKVQVINSSHALPVAVADDESILVMQPGVLPSWNNGVLELSDGGILTLPAGAGAEAGFERIDLARSWAGILVLQGNRLSRLLDLPDDSDPNAALLRIALQAQLTETELDVSALADGAWIMVNDDVERRIVEDKWLARHLPPSQPYSLSQRFAEGALRLGGRIFTARAEVGPGILALAFLLGGAGAIAAWFGMPVLAFALIALVAPTFNIGAGILRLTAPSFGSFRIARYSFLFIDIIIILAGVFSIDGVWFRQVFPPLVLVTALHAKPPAETDLPFMALHDRSVVALIALAGAAMHSAEMGIMAAALAVIAANIALRLRQRG